MLQVATALRATDLLGEGPWWDETTDTLVRVDIKRRQVADWSPATGVERARRLPEEVSIALPCRDGRRVVSQVVGLALDDGTRLTPLCSIDPDNPHTRLNDGVCDVRGDLWVGTYSTRGEPEAGLFHVRPDGTCTQVLGDLVASNGLAWDPSGEVLFSVDTGRSTISRHRRTADGSLGPSSTFAALDPDRGRPDGIAVDREGHLWVAVWGGGRLERYSPAGSLDLSVALPVTYPTALAFGGAALDHLFVTTSSHHLAPGTQEPEAGSILVVRTDVAGMPVRRFAG